MVCESCIEAVLEEGPDLELEEAKAICIDLGADIPDHLCDTRPAGDDSCQCACRRHYRRGK